MLPKISIIVPSYNAVNTIERTIISLLKQNYSNLELIFVDGQSSDGTQGVVEKYSDQIAVFISEQDESQSEALNKGLRLATGELLGWLCADDELADGALLKVGNFFEKNEQIDVLTGGCLRIFGSDSRHITTPGDEYFSSLFMKNTIEQPSTFWRSRVHQRVGALNEGMKYAFDWEYWCRMKAVGCEFAKIDDTLSVYHFSDSNLTSTGGRAIVDEMYEIVRQFGPYSGRLAWAYRFLYQVFDLRGFYDGDGQRSAIGKGLFYAALRVLYFIYDEQSINTYNWNFASRQERGVGW